jgi:alcohol dehydrogenase (cytochrome c)
MNLRKLARLFAVAAAILTIAAAALVTTSYGARWRATVLASKLTGDLEDLSWLELLSMLRPGSPFYLEGLADTPSPYAVIRNPHMSAADRQAGAEIFVSRCATCHGSQGQGQTAPRLVDRQLKNGDSDWSLFRAVVKGVPARGMPPSGLADLQAWQVVAHVRTLRSRATALDNEVGRPPPIDVPAGRIEAAGADSDNWLTYSGDYRSWRHFASDEINADNVQSLTLAWALQLYGVTDAVEASPIVVDGVMYFTVPPNDVYAIEAATGKVFWRYSRRADNLRLCCGIVNRGVAVLGGRVFVGTADSHAVALDAQTGKVVWETKVAEHSHGYSITAAPLAVGDKVVFGISGGEYGIRGFLDAYDAATGERAWRFYTIPEPGQPGSETWSGDAWRTGGGPTWVTGSFDPALGLVYWGVGNPSPDFNGDVRPGDNLYSNSVIAVRVHDGMLAWHFQFTPHDEHDWDANQIPVLLDADFNGTPRRLMLWANRNGFYYVLDRATGEFLHATPFVRQNWAERIDRTGRPILTAEAIPSPRGTLTWPGVSGGANWWSPSYSPITRHIYVPFADAPKVFFKNTETDSGDYAPGMPYLGGVAGSTDDRLHAGIKALDATTGAVAWEYRRREPRPDIGRIGGALSTAGNLVFFGDLNDFVAVAADTGREVWRVNLGGDINASPIGFSAGGRPHVAIPAGNTLYVFRR